MSVENSAVGCRNTDVRKEMLGGIHNGIGMRRGFNPCHKGANRRIVHRGIGEMLQADDPSSAARANTY